MGIPVTKQVARHPGNLIAHLLEENELTQSDLAKGLGVTQAKISEIINGHRGIGIEMAVKLGKFFETGPELWVDLQSAWDLSRVDQKSVTKGIKTVDQYRKAA